MNIFQLDECINGKKLEKGCSEEGLCKVYRYPRNLKGEKDPQMLNELLPKGNPLVTIDYALLEDHLNAIPAKHPGIIIINNEIPKTITLKIVRSILARFKSSFPEWYNLSLNNSIVLLTQESIEISHIESCGELKSDGEFSYNVPDFANTILNALEKKLES
ncbi:MAG: hypothetical protein AAGG51_22205 [Cyanobacteria bacterium P01_G01_bin.54]